MYSSEFINTIYYRMFAFVIYVDLRLKFLVFIIRLGFAIFSVCVYIMYYIYTINTNVRFLLSVIYDLDIIISVFLWKKFEFLYTYLVIVFLLDFKC